MLYPIDSNISGSAETGRLFSIASWLRPRSYWDVVVLHLPLGLIAAIALLLPYCASLERLPAIPCTFLHLTGYPCPLCGFTRSFWAIATGQWAFAFANCPMAFPVFLSVVIVLFWNVTALLFGVVLSRGPLLQLTPKYRRKAAVTVLLLFSLNWAYRLAVGLT
jgi:hypothetical protein